MNFIVKESLGQDLKTLDIKDNIVKDEKHFPLKCVTY